MIAVIFEVWPKDGHRQEYLDIAAALRPLLDGIDGFLSIERFESLSQPGKILSLSFWRDEEAVAAWRRLEEHRAAQSKGRSVIFSDYRLRIADVLRDYGMDSRAEAPLDSQAFHQGDSEDPYHPITPSPITHDPCLAWSMHSLTYCRRLFRDAANSRRRRRYGANRSRRRRRSPPTRGHLRDPQR